MKTVPLIGKKAAGRVALVDDADFKFVMQFRWSVCEVERTETRPAGPYAQAWMQVDGKGRYVKMHQLLTGYPQTDHADHNGLNNQRSNLREATTQQNMRNKRPNINAASPYKGVHWDKQHRKWRACIGIDGKRRHLGMFSSEELAALAYDRAARELFGEFASPNFAEPKRRPGRYPTFVYPPPR